MLGNSTSRNFVIECRTCNVLVGGNDKDTQAASTNTEQIPTDKAEIKAEESPFIALHHLARKAQSLNSTHTGVVGHNHVCH